MPATFASGQGEGPKDPGPWPDKVLEVMTLPVPKKPCTLCEFWFAVPCLTGVGSFKSVLAKKASFGDKAAKAKLNDDRTSASRLYSGVPLCCFCSQLVVPDPEEARSPKSAKKGKRTSEPEVTPSKFLMSFLNKDVDD